LGLRKGLPVRAIPPSINPLDAKNRTKSWQFIEATRDAIQAELQAGREKLLGAARRAGNPYQEEIPVDLTDRQIALFVGRPHPDKGIPDVIHGFVAAYKRLKQAPHEGKLPALILSLGRADDNPTGITFMENLEALIESLRRSEDADIREAAWQIHIYQ